MKKIITYIFLLFILFSCSKDELNILPPNTVWKKGINLRNGTQVLNSIEQNAHVLQPTPDNGFVLVINNAIRKYSTEGDSLWQKNYSTPVKAIQPLDNNKYLLYSSTADSLWLTKVNQNWEVEWEKSIIFNANLSPVFQDISVMADGYVIAIRLGEDANAHSHLYKVNLNGEVMWNNKFMNTRLIALRAMEVSRDGNLFLAGGGSRNSTKLTRPWMAKIDNNNGSIVEATFFDEEDDVFYNDNEHKYFSGIQENASGNFLLLMNADYNTDVIILDEKNEIQYRNDLSTSNFNAVIPTNDSHYLLVNQSGYNNYCFAKLDDNGHRVWQLNLDEFDFFGERFPHRGITACQLTDGSYLLLTNDFYGAIYLMTKIQRN